MPVPEPKRLAPRVGCLRRSDVLLLGPVKKIVDLVVADTGSSARTGSRTGLHLAQLYEEHPELTAES